MNRDFVHTICVSLRNYTATKYFIDILIISMKKLPSVLVAFKHVFARALALYQCEYPDFY